jgi:hypothetical protein
LRRQSPGAVQARGQRFAVKPLHDEIARAIGQVPVIEHFHDVRVPGQTERGGFAAQTVCGDRVVGDRGSQQLDRDGRAVRQSNRFPDRAAGTGAEFFPEPVLPGDDRALVKSGGAPLARVAQGGGPLERANAAELRA